MLKMNNYQVDVCVVGSLDKMSAEAKIQLEMYQAISGNFVTAPVYDEYTMIVDAIFGIGCNREITGIAAEVIEAINKNNGNIIAVDVPSGVSSDTGKICGVAVKAEKTVTFFTEKFGMMVYPGREFCGKVSVADLGIPFQDWEECQAVTYCDEDIVKLPKRRGNSHKGTYGKVLVIAGSEKISGAAYLAAAGAYRIGAGLVKVYTPKENKIQDNSLQISRRTLACKLHCNVYNKCSL
jgi:NAD(P)H-hydrate epimerase